MAKWLIVIFIAAWFLNSHVILYFFPYTTVDEYYRFIATRNVVYEAMFLMLTVALYLQSSGILKALACFAMIMIAASVIDKAVFKITDYLWSDVIMIFVALISSYKVYVRNRPKLD